MVCARRAGRVISESKYALPVLAEIREKSHLICAMLIRPGYDQYQKFYEITQKRFKSTLANNVSNQSH